MARNKNSLPSSGSREPLWKQQAAQRQGAAKPPAKNVRPRRMPVGSAPDPKHPSVGPAPDRGPISAARKVSNDRRSPRSKRALGWGIKIPLHAAWIVGGAVLLTHVLGANESGPEAPVPYLDNSQPGANVENNGGHLPATYDKDNPGGEQLVCDAAYYDAGKGRFINHPVVGTISQEGKNHFAPAQIDPLSHDAVRLDRAQTPNPGSGWAVGKSGELSLDPPENSCHLENLTTEQLNYDTHELGRTSLLTLVDAGHHPDKGTLIDVTHAVRGVIDQELTKPPQ